MNSSSSDDDGLLVAPTYERVLWGDGGGLGSGILTAGWRWIAGGQRDTPAPEQPAADGMHHLANLVRELSDGGCLARLSSEHAAASFEAVEEYYDTRPELARYTVATELSRMEYQIHTGEGQQLRDPVILGLRLPRHTRPTGLRLARAATRRPCARAQVAIRQYYEGTSSASAASCADAPGCELLWRMANQSLLSYLLQPLQERWLVCDSSGCTSLSMSACRMVLSVPERSLRCECTLQIACECNGERLEVADCVGKVAMCLNDRSFTTSVGRPVLRVKADGTPHGAPKPNARTR
eukprot:4136835-Prymnesium_polylepis.1